MIACHLLRKTRLLRTTSNFRNFLSLSYSSQGNKSDEMVNILKAKFPLAKNIEVVDVSGGCGAMYEVLVESAEFKGLSTIKQHRLINETLKEQIREMHGLRIHTVIPK